MCIKHSLVHTIHSVPHSIGGTGEHTKCVLQQFKLVVHTDVATNFASGTYKELLYDVYMLLGVCVSVCKCLVWCSAQEPRYRNEH